jgi:hypothetical protein
MADKVDDGIQHGIDDNPRDDPKKGAVLGGVGGAVVGALAGGPIGAVIGAVAGAAASGAAVAAVDQVDNDNTVTGLGDGATADAEDQLDDAADYRTTGSTAGATGLGTTGLGTTSTLGSTGVGTGSTLGGTTGIGGTGIGNDVPGIQTGGRDIDGTPDTRGITEKAADAVTGDHIDDKTGKPVL